MTDLNAALTRLRAYSDPPTDVVDGALDAYAEHVATLEAAIERLNTRVGEEVAFQSFIRKSEAEARTARARQHEQDRRELIGAIGFAAKIRDRVYKAQSEGRKTVRVDALLDGGPKAGD